MKAIILAAGRWTRLRPITNTNPKPLIKIAWKSILEHNLDIIYKKVDEVIIVVKYLKEKIIDEIWDNYRWTKISYITQWDEKWTGAAIKWLNFDLDTIIMNWDSIFHKDDINALLDINWYWVLVQKVKSPEKYWIFKVDENNNISNIVEKPSNFIWILANLWVYKFNSKIFEYVNNIELSTRGEYEITDAINLFVKAFPFKAIEINHSFIDIWYPWDIITANKYFLDKFSSSDIKWTIEEWVTIKWNIVLEEWAILKSWTYIEGNCYIWKDTSIWPNTYLRWSTVIWDNCKVWNAVEIKNSSIWNNTNSPHLSYIWDSVIWNNVNLAWGFMVANLRHDWKNIKMPIKWKLIDTWRRKLWCIIWDNVKTWMKTSVYPWRVIENNIMTIPNQEIK